MQEAKALSLRFAHGPRGWLHGKAGEAHFRAESELGLKSVPRCVEASGLADAYCTRMHFLPDFATKLAQLDDAF